MVVLNSANEIRALKRYGAAFAHREAADKLSGELSDQKSLVRSTVILRPFALELLIKAGLLAESGSCPRDHNLIKLFMKLPEISRQLAENQFVERTGKFLRSFLTAEQSTFVDWRYTDEKKDLKTYPELLGVAFNCISSALLLTHPIFNNAECYCTE